MAFNNEKSWFDRNRKRYEEFVREPFKSFVVDLIEEIQKFDSTIGSLQPKDVMFRINRDLRFTKDKTPYNTWLSAAIMPGGKRTDEQKPGYYFRFAVDKVSLGGGLYHPNRDDLLKIRRKIAQDSMSLHKILDSKGFRSVWGVLQGDENKIVPAEFKEVTKTEPYLKKKSFTYWLEASEMEVLREDLMVWMIDKYKVGKIFNDFLRV